MSGSPHTATSSAASPTQQSGGADLQADSMDRVEDALAELLDTAAIGRVLRVVGLELHLARAH